MRGQGSGSSSTRGPRRGGRSGRGRVHAIPEGGQQPGDMPEGGQRPGDMPEGGQQPDHIPQQPTVVEAPPVLDAQERVLCVPDARREKLLDSGRVSLSMREIFRKSWLLNGTTWRFLTADQMDYYWDEFKKEYWWDGATYSEDVIKRVFMTHARDHYKDVVNKMKKDAKKKSDIARANRLSEPAGPGTGPVRHACGSRSAIKHMTALGAELGRKPTAMELYNRIHALKADKSVMIDKRAQDMQDAIGQRLSEASLTQTSRDSSSKGTTNMDETQLFLDIEGVNKKRHVYGLGSATSAYIDTAASSRARSNSSSQSVQMPDDEIDRRVQAGIDERLRQMNADMETRMTALVRAELQKMMPNLPPEFRPPTHPPGDDDDTSAV
ncbi:hypothetical protein M5689_003159 [Euphorbia peplus]|nr:hypothetical protein M5689_003159 [Euphorbia peplus]